MLDVTPRRSIRGPQLRRRTAGVAGLGAALPERVVPNAEIAPLIGVDEAWIERRTGIRERRRVAPGERLSDLALEAARSALDDAGVEDVDLIVVATMTADEVTPGVAPFVAHGLGSNAAAIDLNAACTGFLAGLDLAAASIESGRSDTALVIGAEAMSRIVDPADRRTAGLFGDGAGAAVMAAGAGALGPVVLRSAGEHAGLIVADRDERLVRMEGHETFIVATASLAAATTDAVTLAGLTLADVDRFVFHQANRRILDAVADRLEIDRDRVVDAIADVGNTSAASLPLALAEQRPASGETVVLGAMGAGFVYGAGVLTWA